jgi:diguanylate cyclase (GGDEF)-like protein/PAS domain S-box-containing protein
VHSLLKRQIAKFFADEKMIPESLQPFISAVNSAYEQSDEDRAMLERALEISSEEMRESEERYALAVHAANDGLWDWNLKTNEFYFSPRWKAMLGYKEDEIKNNPVEWFKRVHSQDLIPLQIAISTHLNGETEHFESEYRILHSNNSYRWMLTRGLAVRDRNGIVYRMAGSQADITDRKLAEERLVHDALHDALTGLPNRILFMDRLSQRLEHAQRHPYDSFAVLFIDLDRFKIINDSLGHSIGDKFLIATSHRLQSCLRTEDTISRLGGDEFAILLNDVNEINEAIRVAERIQKRLMSTTMLVSTGRSSTASIGITLFNIDYTNPQDMLRDADTAMYRAKTQGGGRYQIFDIDMYASAFAVLQMEMDLKRAIENHEWAVYYQPIISLNSGKMIGVEALVRLMHPQQGLVYPLEFINVAEETGLILPIGEYVLRIACAQAKAWRNAGLSKFWVAVNISGRQFQDQRLLTMIKQILLETGCPSDILRLEVTESVAMKDLTHSIRVLNELNRLGIHVSLDDFGKGYSSLSYLKSFPLKVLKIDRSFMQDMDVDKKNEAIISTIISMGHTLNLEVIAEGVEKEEQLAFLKSQYCDAVQGFLLGRPVSGEELSRIFNHEPYFPIINGERSTH